RTHLRTVLEPDGDFGHWIRVDSGLQKATGLSSGDSATVEVEPTKQWPEPRRLVSNGSRRLAGCGPRPLRCSSVKYARYSPSSRLAAGAPRSARLGPPFNTSLLGLAQVGLDGVDHAAHGWLLPAQPFDLADRADHR